MKLNNQFVSIGERWAKKPNDDTIIHSYACRLPIPVST